MTRQALGQYLLLLLLIGFLAVPSTVPASGRSPALIIPTLTATPFAQANAKTILIEKEGKIWKVDPESFAQKISLDLHLNPALEFGDMYLTLDGQSILAIVGTKFEWNPKPFTPTPDPEDELVQISLSTGAQQAIWHDPFLARMSPVSPDGTKAILMSSNWSKNEDKFCVFDRNTNSCFPIDISVDINPNEFFWLDDATFVTQSLDSIDIYVIDQGSLSKRPSIPLGGTYNRVMTPLPKTSAVVVGRSSSIPPNFFRVDLTTAQVSELNYGLADNYFAAFTHIGLSPDGQYLWYTRANHLNVVDFKTGRGLATLDNVEAILWIPDSQDFVGVLRHSGAPLTLFRYDTPNRKIVRQIGLDTNVTFLGVIDS